MKVTGLTGGIATGKSTVAKLLHDRHGVPVIDLDQVARSVVEPGRPALAAIVERFGPDVLLPDGTLDRAAMRRRIIEDPASRADLERITHPAIQGETLERLGALAAAGVAHAVVEAALMVETGSYKAYQHLVVVSCSAETQLARLMARDGQTEASARALIATQLPLADKEAVADYVIRNDGAPEDLAAQVDEVWSAISSG